MEKNRTGIPEDYQFNLSDFALFLSVMKNPRAYRSVVSTIMEEPDIQIKETFAILSKPNRYTDFKIRQRNKIQNAAIHGDHIHYTGRYL